MSRQLWPLSYGPFVGTRRASLYHTLLALDEALEALGARRVPELPQRLRLDLPDPLARDLEILADLLERVVALLADAEAHPEHLLLARGERGEHLPGLLGQVHVDDRVGRRDERLVLDEVAEVAVLLLADGGLEADRLLRDLEDLADLVERQLHLLGDLLRGGLAPELLHEVAARPDELVDRLDHVDGDADRPRLVGDRAGDRLPDPPRRVRRELVAALVLELVHRLHEADVPLLDEVEELEAAVRVLLRDGDDEPQVRLDELGLRVLRLALTVADGAVGAAQLVDRDLRLLLDAEDLAPCGPHDAIELLDLVHRAAELPRELLAPRLVLARLAQEPAQLADGDAGAPLGVPELPLRLLDPLDEPLELQDDPVDLLLVELDRLEVLHHVGLDGLDLVAELPALHLGELLRREGLLRLRDVPLELADPVDVLQLVLDALRHRDHDGVRDGLDLDLGDLLLDLLLLALRRLLLARVLHDLADADLPLPEPLAEIEDLADGDRRREDRGEHLLLALLDPLRDLDLALAREQGDRAHLAQVHADGIVGLAVAGVLLLLLLLGLVRVLFLRLGRLVRQLHLLLGAVHDLDVVLAEHRHHVVDLVRADVGGERVVHLVVGEEPLHATALHERLHLGPLGDVAHVVGGKLVRRVVVGLVVVLLLLLLLLDALGLGLLVVRPRRLAELRALLALPRLLGARSLRGAAGGLRLGVLGGLDDPRPVVARRLLRPGGDLLDRLLRGVALAGHALHSSNGSAAR